MKKEETVRLIAVFCTAAILITALVCVISLLTAESPTALGGSDASELTADIYQDGKLVTSLSLSSKTVKGSYTRTFTSPGGGTNTVEVRPGEIGIISADCPDRLCVRQGFRHNTLLPIICLPHRLVIQIRAQETDPGNESGAIDNGSFDAIVQ